MDNNWKSTNIKREIFSLYDSARELFNNYYNGFEGAYTSEDIKAIGDVVMDIEHNLGNIKEEIEYYEEVK